MMQIIITAVVAFCLGVLAMGIFKLQPDEECRMCHKAQQEQIKELENKLHAMRSTNGKLGKQLQRKYS
jgi:hypothetical protein